MRRFVFMLLLCAGLSAFAEEPPAAERLDALVTQLGAEPHAVRQEAFETLVAYSGRFPRFMLLELADRYGAAEDLEVRFRLEAILKPLAGRYMFAVPSGFIGINMEWWTDGEAVAAVRVVSVMPGHAGDKAGLRQGDLIVKVDGDSVREMGTLQVFSERIAGIAPGTFVRLDVTRGNAPVVIHFPLDARPSNLEPSAAVIPWRLAFAGWLREISGRSEPDDPTFPIGHFPKNDE
jgi:hypothetical protein